MRYPLIFDLKGKNVIFIGGGKVALRKIEAMTKAQADITVIAPETSGMPENVTHIKKNYDDSDITEKYYMVFACTNSKEVNRQVAEKAKSLKIPVNIADDPEFSDFHTPAVIQHDGFTVSISTDGQNPSASKSMREALEKFFSMK